MAAEPARRLSRLQLQLTTCAIRVQALYTLLDAVPAEDEPSGCPNLVVRGGEVRFEDVSFAYHKEAPALTDFSLTAPAGRTTALVGLSGSGKTTVFNLIQRFWLPTSGTILIDGQSITEVSLASLRRQIALVSQDVFLFEGTIRDNLTMEKGDVSENAIVAAVRAAHAEEFIDSLPHGFDTQVGELGGKLSGGQRQRISIARAFLKDAPIILLDEPTSAVDSETEWRIQSALKDLTRGRTTIVIAHRLATVANADLIHVIEAGRLVESGTQRELVRRDGLYAKLHRIQFAGMDAVDHG
jgi:ATP-binding cassette subfamily B protein